jgi:Protein of unknown function (DUF2892)
MKRNLGKYDIGIRLLVGVSLLIVYFISDLNSPLNWILLGVSGILLVTGITGYCPLYTFLNVSTRINHK